MRRSFPVGFEPLGSKTSPRGDMTDFDVFFSEIKPCEHPRRTCCSSKTFWFRWFCARTYSHFPFANAASFVNL